MSGGEIVLRGAHGTPKNLHLEIKKSGCFKISQHEESRLGSGVYFWKQSEFWFELAVAWIRYDQERKASRETIGVVIFCNFCVNENQVLPIGAELRSEAYKVAKALGIKTTDIKNTAKVFDVFISRLECKKGVKYSIIEGEVNPPKGKYFSGLNQYPSWILGPPVTLVVRDVSCIHFEKEIEYLL